ncbi:MAG: hypothetical protein ACP5RK_00735 [Candidatus Micrarchaeia archaeon]
MSALKFVLFALFIAFSSSAYAQYWFQFGARSGNSASMNNGASVQIETITPQNISMGSLGFWVGEILSNGAFLQCGYLIENATGNYPSLCTQSGCTSYQELKAGDAEWFYEYFPPNYNGGFLGGIGPDGSAGTNGSMHTYSFYSIGNTWYFTFDGKVIGSADLGTSTSGAEVPVAFGEVANTSSNNEYVRDVIFENLSSYKYGLWFPAAAGYAYIGYGSGSEKNLRNPYGVKEIDNRVNYFEAGSGLPQPMNGTQLWSLGYYLTIKSAFGNLNSTMGYIAYSSASISAPQYVYVSPDTREVFSGWVGKGIGSYTGPLNYSEISMNSNITETAQWKSEYLVNITSPYGTVSGGGWYANGSTITYSISAPIIYQNSTTRVVFLGWSNGNKNLTGKLMVNKPINLQAIWAKEYLVSAKTPYGNATGAGWYRENTFITLSVPMTVINQTSNERMAFYSWSNGNESPTIRLLVDNPINISAEFKEEYLITLVGENAYGEPVSVQEFAVNGKPTNGTLFLFAGESSKIDYALYKGVEISSGMIINASHPGTVEVPLEIYNVNIKTDDIFGMPVNAYAKLSFSNGSTIEENTNGNLILMNVPYGYVNASVSYLGITQHALLLKGAGAMLTFFSITDALVVVAVIIVIALSYIISKRKFSGKAEEGIEKEQEATGNR